MPVDQEGAVAVNAEPHRLEIRRHIAANRESLFRQWTTAELLERFICPGNTGARVVADVRVGGKFHIDMYGAKGEVWPHDGEYLEVDAPRRLRFTWVSLASPAELGSVVTIDFVEVNGGTDIVLVQDRFADAKALTGHQEGWTKILEQVADVHVPG